MKHLLYLFIFIPLANQAQIIFDFENGNLDDWIQIPSQRWEVTSDFVLQGTKSLHHSFDNSSSGIDIIGKEYLYPDLSDSLFFQFKLRHGYPPSSGNNWQFFMLANSISELASFSENAEAIFLGVNYKSSDDFVKLIQVHEGEPTEICSTNYNYQELVGTSKIVFMRVTRIPDGTWIIETSSEENFKIRQIIGSGKELIPASGKYFGFRYSYSAAQDRKFWADQIEIGGDFYKDTIPPRILAIETKARSELVLSFSENIALKKESSFKWNDNLPDSSKISGKKIYLYFREKFRNRVSEYLQISNIEDEDNNRMNDTIVSFRSNLAVFGDIVINEIMTDPDPPIYLPDCEYIELYNRYEDTLVLEAYTLQVNGRLYSIPFISIPPRAYLLLVPEECESYDHISSSYKIISSTALLPNQKGSIVVKDQLDRIIHTLDYEIPDEEIHKSEGGWSLECIDPDNLCGGRENWKYSSDILGGTPGKINSKFGYNADRISPQLLFIGISQSKQITLNFNETILIQEEDTINCKLDGTYVDYFIPAYPYVNSFLKFENNLALEENTSFSISISKLEDCSDNILLDTSLEIMLPEVSAVRNLRLNEIMYDPMYGNEEYIEIYNKSDSFADLKDLKLEVLDPKSATRKIISLSLESHIIFPGAYIVLCKNPASLREEWTLDWSIDIVELPDWKMLSDAGGCIALLDKSENQIDRMCYDDTLHHDYLGVTTGVSLERINYGLCPQISGCWTSAASSVSYGTPGRENSQQIDTENSLAKISLYPEVFSPDQDGFEDRLSIIIPEEFQNFLLDIHIIDLEGNPVKELISRGIVGAGDHFLWDGLDQDGRLVYPGIYIVKILLYNDSGNHQFLKACALFYR